MPSQLAEVHASTHPNDLHCLDAEDRQYDDTSEGIDWDEIIATTQDDWEAGRYCFSTEDYATHEAGMAALSDWIDTITEEVMRKEATRSL